jgi:gluconolactonase
VKRLTGIRVWICSFVAGLTFLVSAACAQAPDQVTKFDPSLDTILSPESKLEPLKAEGFAGGEGPVWVQDGKSGYLLFSDVPGNRIYKWEPACVKFPCPPDGKLSVFLEHAGYKDAPAANPSSANATPNRGSNGLALDRQHRLIIDANGDRAVDRLEKNGTRTILADRYEGKRFGCPNDIVAKSDGAAYFTDGPGGCLPGGENSPEKELPFHGVYSVKNGTVQLLDKDPGDAPPNGIAFSPDEKILYVTNAPAKRQIFAYDVQPDGSVKNRRVFADLSAEKGLGGPDGLKVDRKGNVYSAATGGLWIFSPDGKRLGKVAAPEGVRFANLAFGDRDGRTLYIVSAKILYRIRLKVAGVRP